LRVLLDTHVFLWLQTEPERVGEHLDTLADPATELLVSAASSWEVAIKHALGRLPLPDTPERWMPERIRAIGARPIAVEHDHALAAAGLPQIHRDPFDRLLVAQAVALDATLITADAALARCPARTLLVGGERAG
jgi:PIN domain nuclease of toxin-antitoxin system